MAMAALGVRHLMPSAPKLQVPRSSTGDFRLGEGSAERLQPPLHTLHILRQGHAPAMKPTSSQRLRLPPAAIFRGPGGQ